MGLNSANQSWPSTFMLAGTLSGSTSAKPPCCCAFVAEGLAILLLGGAPAPRGTMAVFTVWGGVGTDEVDLRFMLGES